MLPRFDAPPGLDVQRGLAFCAGNTEAYFRVLGHFATMYAIRRDVLDAPAPWSEPQREAIRRELHAVGGAAGAVGATALEGKALAIGQRLKAAPDEAALPAHVHDLHDLHDQLRALAGALAGALTAAGRPVTSLGP